MCDFFVQYVSYGQNNACRDEKTSPYLPQLLTFFEICDILNVGYESSSSYKIGDKIWNKKDLRKMIMGSCALIAANTSSRWDTAREITARFAFGHFTSISIPGIARANAAVRWSRSAWSRIRERDIS